MAEASVFYSLTLRFFHSKPDMLSLLWKVSKVSEHAISNSYHCLVIELDMAVETIEGRSLQGMERRSCFRLLG
jgi:hypothetical protein